MNADLEATLRELGPEYRSLVNRIVDAYAEPVRIAHWPRALLIAATIAFALVLSFVLTRSSEPRVNEYHLALIHDEAAIDEIIKTQNQDGSWKNDFLTRQNAEALRTLPGKAAQIAYKRARRNLRVRGLL